MVLDGRQRKNDNNGQPKKQVDPRDDPHDDCMHWLGSL
jgi:hypothetical protein